jgi:hypothetical protein
MKIKTRQDKARHKKDTHDQPDLSCLKTKQRQGKIGPDQSDLARLDLARPDQHRQTSKRRQNTKKHKKTRQDKTKCKTMQTQKNTTRQNARQSIPFADAVPIRGSCASRDLHGWVCGCVWKPKARQRQKGKTHDKAKARHTVPQVLEVVAFSASKEDR